MVEDLNLIEQSPFRNLNDLPSEAQEIIGEANIAGIKWAEAIIQRANSLFSKYDTNPFQENRSSSLPLPDILDSQQGDAFRKVSLGIKSGKTSVFVPGAKQLKRVVRNNKTDLEKLRVARWPLAQTVEQDLAGYEDKSQTIEDMAKKIETFREEKLSDDVPQTPSECSDALEALDSVLEDIAKVAQELPSSAELRVTGASMALEFTFMYQDNKEVMEFEKAFVKYNQLIRHFSGTRDHYSAAYDSLRGAIFVIRLKASQVLRGAILGALGDLQVACEEISELDPEQHQHLIQTEEYINSKVLVLEESLAPPPRVVPPDGGFSVFRGLLAGLSDLPVKNRLLTQVEAKDEEAMQDFAESLSLAKIILRGGQRLKDAKNQPLKTISERLSKLTGEDARKLMTHEERGLLMAVVAGQWEQFVYAMEQLQKIDNQDPLLRKLAADRPQDVALIRSFNLGGSVERLSKLLVNPGYQKRLSTVLTQEQLDHIESVLRSSAAE